MRKQQREKMQKLLVYFILIVFIIGLLPMLFGR
ncbi:DUF4044 domain-containing protein [Clostridium rectalis]|nr:DUF4044 domain-containing protein [Clostridium rectalis]